MAPDDLDEPPPEYPVTIWGVYQMINRVDRRTLSMKQTQDETILPAINRHETELRGLRNRWVYALTMLGASAGAILYLFSKGGGTL